MKKFLVLLLLSAAVYSQPKVYNVQQYCVDKAPFRSGECDIKGNEYSFVFVDDKAKSVVFFFTDTKLTYTFKNVSIDSKSGVASYNLKGATGEIQMNINKPQTKIEFLYTDNRIYLTVGKSTKMK